MLKLLGLKSTENDAAPLMPSQRLSRFESDHSRETQPVRARPLSPPKMTVPLKQAFSPTPPTPVYDDTMDGADQLHSEVGLSPNILRSALPQRFEKMDTEKAAPLGRDFFEMAAARS